MSMSEPIADLLTRIRNGQSAKKTSVVVPASKAKMAVLKVLKDEGYITDFSSNNETKAEITVELKYYLGKPVIEKIRRISRPGLRIFKNKDEIPAINNGQGISIVSTSRGEMTDRAARAKGVGGEVLCTVF